MDHLKYGLPGWRQQETRDNTDKQRSLMSKAEVKEEQSSFGQSFLDNRHFTVVHYLVKTACFENVRSRVRHPLWHSGFLETDVSFPLTREYSGLWGPTIPRSSVFGFGLPGLEIRSLCLKDSVISFISPSSVGSPGPV